MGWTALDKLVCIFSYPVRDDQQDDVRLEQAALITAFDAAGEKTSHISRDKSI